MEIKNTNTWLTPKFLDENKIDGAISCTFMGEGMHKSKTGEEYPFIEFAGQFRNISDIFAIMTFNLRLDKDFLDKYGNDPAKWDNGIDFKVEKYGSRFKVKLP